MIRSTKMMIYNMLLLLSPLLLAASTLAFSPACRQHGRCRSHHHSPTTTVAVTTSSSSIPIPISSSVLSMSNTDVVEQDVNLVLTGNNIDLTDALREYVDKRIGGLLTKLGGGGIVRECDVHLSVYRNPKVKDGHRVELTALLKGLTVHVKEEHADMYTSIDACANALAGKLRKYRTRRKQGYHAGNSMGNDLADAIDALEAEDDEDAVAAEVEQEYMDEAFSRGNFIDPESPDVMKVNSFDLENPVPMQEAIFALDYVDHDFFVFKNKDTGKKSIVYKRNAGGVGLIEIE